MGRYSEYEIRSLPGDFGRSVNVYDSKESIGEMLFQLV